MGEVANTNTPAAQPAAPAPASTPAPAASPAPAQGAPTAAPEPTAAPPGAQPTQTPQEGASTQAPAAPDGPPAIPWARFREVQTTNTKLKQQLAEIERQQGAQVNEWKTKYEQRAQFEQDYRALEQALRANPDLAEALAQRLGGQPQPQQAPVAQLPKEVVEKLSVLDTLKAQLDAQKQREAKMAEQQQLQQIEAEFKSSVEGLLKKHNYADRQYQKAADYILRRAATMGDDLGMEDVAPLFYEWRKEYEAERQSWLEEYTKGKREDAGLPVPPNGSVPVRPVPQMGANDRQTSSILANELAKRGWGNPAR